MVNSFVNRKIALQEWQIHHMYKCQITELNQYDYTVLTFILFSWIKIHFQINSVIAIKRNLTNNSQQKINSHLHKI